MRASVFRKAIRLIGGFGLVILGIVGLIMPVMPGWVFLIPGLVILSEYFPPVKRLVDWAKAKLEEHDPGFMRKKSPVPAPTEPESKA